MIASMNTPLPIPRGRKVSERDFAIGQKVRARRNQLNISLEKLAEEIGVTYQQLQKYEKGDNRIGTSRLLDIATALDVSLLYFIEGEAERDTLTEDAIAELITEYRKIKSPKMRKRIFELVRTAAELD